MKKIFIAALLMLSSMSTFASRITIVLSPCDEVPSYVTLENLTEEQIAQIQAQLMKKCDDLHSDEGGNGGIGGN